MKIPQDMRHGTIHHGKYGSMKVIKYHHSSRVCIEFVRTGYRAISQSAHVRRGTVIDKLAPSVFGVGFIGDGIYNSKSDKTAYIKWHSMMQRCYSDDYHEGKPTYKDCEVCEEWQDFQEFAKWHYENYPNTGGMWHLDKDIRIKGNKIYSPETCDYVSPEENSREKEDRFRTEGLLLSPDGLIFKVTNQAKFCRDNNLGKASVCRMINGKQIKHRGWTVPKQ